MATQRKFILADQSISSIAGHHYEYAVHVLEAAARAGYTPVLATHERFRRDPAAKSAPWKVLSVYRYGFWAAQGPPRFALLGGLRGAFAKFRFRTRTAFTFSPWGLAWRMRTRLSDFLFEQPIDKAHLAALPLLVAAILLLKMLRLAALLAVFPAAAAVFAVRAIYLLGSAGGFPPTYARSLLADAADFRRLIHLLLSRRVQILKWVQQYRCIRGFAADTRRLLEEADPRDGDIIFLPTVSPIELMGLAALTPRSAAARRVSWRLMFRRDIYRGRADEYAAQEASLNDLRQVFQTCRAKLAGARIAFFTDTDELTAQYNRLGAFRFRTGPIPHTHLPVERAADPARPLRLIYIGDARKEKGFPHLPHLIHRLWQDYVETGRATFHFQANYNIPQGEPEAVIARTRMEGWPAAKVELIGQPLTSEQYRRFLLSGDINLLLYDTANYYARSSGILVESLTAGVPVLVPAGTWLARQFLEPYYCHQERLGQTLPRLAAYCLEDLRWRVHGNPKLNPCTAGGLTATRDGKAYTRVDVPAGATHVLVKLRFGAGAGEGHCTLDQLDERGHSLAAVFPRLLEGAGETRRATALIPLHGRAARVWVAVSSLFAHTSVTIPAFEILFLKAETPPPTGAVGLICHHLDEAPGLAAELIDQHPYYAATAREFARSWYGYHNAGRLVELLQ